MAKRIKQPNKKKSKNRYLWILNVFIITFILATAIGFLSDFAIKSFDDIIGPIITISIIVIIGIIFDTIGIAVTAAESSSFTAMSSKKIKGAVVASYLIKNADHVSNICNDVVGDICGIISGAGGGYLVILLVQSDLGSFEVFISVIVSALIAAFTVGGKGIGKILAIQHSQEIVLRVSKILSIFVNESNQKKRKK